MVEPIVELMKDVSASDQVVIAISSLALLVSIATVFVPALKSDRDNRTVVRQQMNNLILEINMVIIENVQMTAMPATTAQEQAARTFASTLVLQKAMPLAMQGVVLINQAPRVMNEMDYSTVGDVARIASNWEIANKYYEQAIKMGKRSRNSTLFNNITFLRGYAHILFEQGEFENGRKLYQDAINMVKKDTDIYKHMTGYTHLMWYADESNIALNHKSSEPHYKACKVVYESITNRSVRSDCLNLLETMKRRVSSTNG